MEDDEEYVELKKPFKVPVCEHVKYYLVQNNMKVAELSYKMGMEDDFYTVLNFVTGKTKPTEDLLARVAKATETPVSFWINLQRDQDRYYNHYNQ